MAGLCNLNKHPRLLAHAVWEALCHRKWALYLRAFISRRPTARPSPRPATCGTTTQLLALPLPAMAHIERQCIVPASAAQLVFVLGRSKGAVPTVVTSSLRLSGTIRFLQ